MIIGVDYASVDANQPPDFAAFKVACKTFGSTAAFAIFRAAWGTSPDPTVGRDWRRAKDAGLIVGAYLYLRMRTATPEDQVHLFADNLGTITDKDLVPTIDVEDAGLGDPALELEIVTRASDAMEAIYGVPPMIYTSGRVWHEDLHDLPAGKLIDSPLWLAKPWPWAVRTPARLSGKSFEDGAFDPPVPKPWGPKNWWFHQYQGDAYPVAGFRNTVDLSRFNVMRQGETGPRVAWVQSGLSVRETGVFDAVLSGHLRVFQQSHGLVADAVIGPLTFTALAWCRRQRPGISARTA